MQSIIKTMEMDIKELTEKYRERFEAFYHTEGKTTDEYAMYGKYHRIKTGVVFI